MKKYNPTKFVNPFNHGGSMSNLTLIQIVGLIVFGFVLGYIAAL